MVVTLKVYYTVLCMKCACNTVCYKQACHTLAARHLLGKAASKRHAAQVRQC